MLGNGDSSAPGEAKERAPGQADAGDDEQPAEAVPRSSPTQSGRDAQLPPTTQPAQRMPIARSAPGPPLTPVT